MIEGFVNARYEPVISIPLQGPSGLAQEIEAVADTGHNGYITLPPGLVAELGLTLQSEGWATLANGSVETFDIYGVTMLWGGQPRYVDADAVGPTPLAEPGRSFAGVALAALADGLSMSTMPPCCGTAGQDASRAVLLAFYLD